MGRPTDEPLQRDQTDLGSAATEDGAGVAPEIAPEPAEPAPLLELRDGLPPVVDTPDAYARVVEAFGAGISSQKTSGRSRAPRNCATASRNSSGNAEGSTRGS